METEASNPESKASLGLHSVTMIQEKRVRGVGEQRRSGKAACTPNVTHSTITSELVISQ